MISRRGCAAICCLLVLLTAAALPAEEAKDKDYDYVMDEVIVIGDKQVSPEITRQEIPVKVAEKPVISTIPDILDVTAGLDIQRRSILTPKQSQVRIRGMDERRSLILIDGRPLNGTGVMGGFFVDWSVLSTENFEAVEITKGGFSAKHGNTLGGTINMRSVPPAETFSARLNTGFKRYDTFTAGGLVSGRTGPFGLVFSGGYDETDGHLRNSQAERYNASGRLHYYWSDNGEIRFSVRHTDGDFGMPVQNRKENADYDGDYPDHAGTYLTGPGIKFPQGDRHGNDSYFNKVRTEVDLAAKKRIGEIDSRLTLYFNNEDRTDYIYSNQTGEKILERDAVPDRSYGWLSKFVWPLNTHLIGFGLDGNYLGYGGADNTFIRPDYFPRPPGEGSDEWNSTRWHGAYIDDEWDISDQFDLYLGLRFDDYYGEREVDVVTGYENGKPAEFEKQTAEFNESVFLPKAGIVFQPVKKLSFYARAARATRYPDNPAFYWYHAGYRPEVDERVDVVRDDLTYEDALEFEVGSRWKIFPGVSFKLSAYHYRVDDYIRWIFGYPPSRLVYNIDQVDFQGIEADIDGQIWGGLSGFANFTWQETEKSGDVLDASNDLTDSLSELPEKKFNCGVKYVHTSGARANLTVRWVDDRKVPYLEDPVTNPLVGEDNPDGTAIFSKSPTVLKKLDSFVTMDIFLKYPVWKKGFAGYLTAGVENLLDEDYEEEYGFPAPGRSYSIGAEVEF